MGVTLADEHVRAVLNKLDTVKVELLRLRAMLLPEGALTEREKRDITAARREYAEGKSLTLKDILKELGDEDDEQKDSAARTRFELASPARKGSVGRISFGRPANTHGWL